MWSRKLSQASLVLYLAMTCQLASAQSLPGVTDAMNDIFTLVETKLGEFFPAGSQTQLFQDYVYRFYEPTGTYLAFADGDVLILGGAFGSTVVNVGSIPSVVSVLEAYQVPETAGELWNLSISGTVSFLGQAIDFEDIVVEDVVAPDIANADLLAEFMNANLDDLPVDGNALSIVVVSNSESQRIVDVSFSLTVDGLTAGYDLRMTFTR